MQVLQTIPTILLFISGSNMRKIQIIFILFCLAGISLPIFLFNTKGTISEKENRNLAQRPHILNENHLNSNYFKEFSSYFDDRFGGRQKLINLNSFLKIKLNGDIPICNDRAVQGRSGWWFYISSKDGNNLQDFYKNNLMNDNQLIDFKKKISDTVEWCKEEKIPCIFMICPNKHSVYDEYYYFSRPEGITRADQISKIFSELNVPFLFPRDYLISKKSEYDFPLYYETDTHWNSQGAYLAAILLKEEIKNIFPHTDFPEIQYETQIDYSMNEGDILPMLGIQEAKSTQPALFPIGQQTSDFYTYIKNEEMQGVITKGTKEKLPRALIFRDSFFSTLEPFVSPMFSEAEYKWKQFREEDKDYILEYKPDIIIFESVERYAPTIVN